MQGPTQPNKKNILLYALKEKKGNKQPLNLLIEINRSDIYIRPVSKGLKCLFMHTNLEKYKKEKNDDVDLL